MKMEKRMSYKDFKYLYPNNKHWDYDKETKTIMVEIPDTTEMKKGIKKKVDSHKCYIYDFASISELVEYNKHEATSGFKKNGEKSLLTDSIRIEFTGTANFSEAMDLLSHGWESKAKVLTSKLPVKKNGNGYSTKNFYSVQGFQCSVPRYLQGMPDSMIANKRVVTKNKVIDITKNVSFSGGVSTETIENECLKVLALVQKLESEGQKVNLYVTFPTSTSYGSSTSTINIFRVKIKSASQRLNVKQMAFPLCHPSMLRRIMFRAVEVTETCNLTSYYRTYGYIFNDMKVLKQCFDKGTKQYIIPATVPEEEITDLSKYEL